MPFMQKVISKVDVKTVLHTMPNIRHASIQKNILHTSDLYKPCSASYIYMISHGRMFLMLDKLVFHPILQ